MVAAMMLCEKCTAKCFVIQVRGNAEKYIRRRYECPCGALCRTIGIENGGRPMREPRGENLAAWEEAL
jgi:hypothetical protein